MPFVLACPLLDGTPSCGSCGSGGSCHTESIRPAAPSRLPEGRPFPFNRPTGDTRERAQRALSTSGSEEEKALYKKSFYAYG